MKKYKRGLKRIVAMVLALILTATTVDVSALTVSAAPIGLRQEEIHIHENEEISEIADVENETETADAEAMTESVGAQEETITTEENVVVEAQTEEMVANKEALSALIEGETTLVESVSQNYVPTVELPDNDELFAGYVDKMFYGGIATYGRAAREQLDSDTAKALYDYLKTQITSVAGGSLASTVFSPDVTTLNAKYTYTAADLGVDSILVKKENDEYAISDAAKNAAFAAFWEQFEMSTLNDALLHDCPYELYWYDKVTGVGWGNSMSANSSSITVVDPFIRFSVAGTYKNADYTKNAPAVDTTLTSATSTAVTNAQAIVTEHKDKADYEKLTAYRDEICELVEYNHDAAEAGNFSENANPWQLIYVFDKDENTKVVCEGYSKAFQYLFDQSTFANDIECYTITGEMNSGGHMWNIVTMEDDKNYMVDITNSDSGSIGQNGGLFLTGTTGSIAEGYTFAISSKNVVYTYDDDIKVLWGIGSDSILVLADADYTPGCLHQNGTKINSNNNIITDTCADCEAECGKATITAADTVYNGSAYDSVNVTATGTLEGKTWTITYNGTVNEYNSTTPPTDAGKYTASITVSNATATSEAFSIAPKPVSIEGMTAVNHIYNGASTVQLTGGTITDVVLGDIVTIDLTDASGEMADAKVGDGKSVTVTGVKLGGEDADNYELKEQPTGVTVNVSYLSDPTTILYNSAEEKEWYGSTDVVITAEGYRVSDTLNGTYTDSYTFTYNADGTYEKKLYFMNERGQMTNYVVVNVQYDRTAPTIEVSDLGNTILDTSAAVTVTAIDGDNGSGADTYYLVYNTSELTEVKKENIAGYDGVISNTTGEFELSGLTPNKKYYYAVAVNDKAGNISDVSNSIFTTKKTIPTFNVADIPTISGTYGQTLNAMTLSKTTDTSSNNIEGTWSITEASAEEIYPTVGGQTAYEITFTPNNTENYEVYTTTTVPTVEKKVLNITFATATERTYEMNNTSVAITDIVLDGKANNTDVVSVVTDGLTGTLSSADVDEYTTVTLPQNLVLTGDQADNYVLEENRRVSTNVAITKTDAPTSIPEGNMTYVYTQNLTGENVRITGLPGGYGSAAYSFDSETDAGEIISNIAVSDSGVITYDVTALSEYIEDVTAQIKVNVEMRNYNDLTYTLNISITDKTVQELTASNISLTYGDADTTISVDGNENTLTYEVIEDSIIDSDVVTVDEDGKIHIVNAGTAKVKITAAGTDIYEEAVCEIMVTVAKKKLTVEWTDTEFTYDGSVHKPTATSKGVITGDSCNVTVTGEQTNAGEGYIATASVNNSNYEIESGETTTFTIKKANPTVTEAPTVEERVYHPSGALSDSDLTGGIVTGVDGKALSGTWSWQTANTIPEVNNSGYVAVFTPNDSTNYEPVTATITVKVTAAELQVLDVTAESKVYDKTAAVKITGMTLNGILDQDEVAVDLTELTGTVSSANAGTYTSVTLPELALTGKDAGNYTLLQPTEAVTVKNGVEITLADASITVGKTAYQKTFGDADFALEDIAAVGEGKLIYTVSDGKDLEGQTKDAASILTVSEDGVATIRGNGSVIVTVAMEENANYNTPQPKQITVDVALADGFFVDEPEEMTYTGKAIKPEVQVYDGTKEVLLQKGKDYTVTYKNNTNAYTLEKDDEGFDATKAPQVIVKGKGNYSETLTVYFTIQPKDISDLKDESIVAKEILLEANGKVQKKVPAITYNKKKLSGVLKPEAGSAPAKEKDFVYSYPQLSEEATKDKAFNEVGIWKILVEGTGNYTGSRSVDVVIAPKGGKMSSAKIKSIPAQKYNDGKPVELDNTELVVTAKVGGKTTTLERGTHYDVRYKNNEDIGTATVIITGIAKNGFAGSKSATFKIVGTSIAKASVEGIEPKVYNGSEQIQNLTITLSKKVQTENGTETQTTTLIEDKDFTVTYDKNVNVGTAKMTIQGIGAYSGTIKKTFKINPYDMTGETDAAGKTKENSSLTEANGLFEMANGQLSVKYVKGGAKPSVKLVFNGTTLTEGKDYTVSYKNNTNVYTLKEGEDGYKANKAPAITIKGKGNFKGTVTKTFVITGRSLQDSDVAVTMTVNDKVVSTKKGGYISKPVLTDKDGKVLKQGKDYTAPDYTMTGENGETITLTKNDKVEVGTEITVTVKGLGAYVAPEEDSVNAEDDGNTDNDSVIVGTYRITSKDFGQVKVQTIKKEYTGYKVTLTEADFYNEDGSSKITIGSGTNKVELKYGVDFEIVPDSYKNNIKKGTASVTLRGISDTADGGSGLYGGTKTIKFQIGTRGLRDWFRWLGF